MFRLTERLLRLEPKVAISINEQEYLVSFCGSVYRVNFVTGEIINEHNYRLGMNNTVNFCKINKIEGFDDCIVYGEYWGNPTREEVSIYLRKENQWGKVFSFPKGKVQHIHGIVADPYRNCIIILTGDKDQESGIWLAKNNFREVKPLLIGSQRYRACVAFPCQEGILLATDSPLEKNSISMLTPSNHIWTEKVLYDMPGPCIYGAKFLNKYVFATSVEPDSRITGIKYWFTYRLGQGVKGRYSHIVTGSLGEGFAEVIRLKKDIFPMLLFQFGNVQFPSGIMEENLVMYPMGVRNYDGSTVICKF